MQQLLNHAGNVTNGALLITRLQGSYKFFKDNIFINPTQKKLFITYSILAQQSLIKAFGSSYI
jgi:hypothetical protein